MNQKMVCTHKGPWFLLSGGTNSIGPKYNEVVTIVDKAVKYGYNLVSTQEYGSKEWYLANCFAPIISDDVKESLKQYTPMEATPKRIPEPA